MENKSYKRAGRKRLTLDLPIAIHNEMRIRAMHLQCTLTAYVIRALIEKLNVERSREIIS